ncbi:MAG: leucyl/phenylalanyl-tRNA---protein transferase, partial [Actinomycetota bacterium]|nr:leucyl/phenylalanyl-tRNA---protein transferase [Actinomycetota bacterium]
CGWAGGVTGGGGGGCFTGESMFHREADGSKVAFVDLVDRWRSAGGSVVDVQIPTDHLTGLGVVAVGRAEFMALLARVRDDVVCVARDRLPVSRLVGSAVG